LIRAVLQKSHMVAVSANGVGSNFLVEFVDLLLLLVFFLILLAPYNWLWLGRMNNNDRLWSEMQYLAEGT